MKKARVPSSDDVPILFNGVLHVVMYIYVVNSKNLRITKPLPYLEKATYKANFDSQLKPYMVFSLWKIVSIKHSHTVY